MKNSLIIFSICIFCSCKHSENKHLTYQNIVILSDMSNRLEKRQCKDIEEIHRLLAFFKDECVRPGEKIGDKSSISFSAFSATTAASIDIDKIKNVNEKQQFINSTGDYRNKGLLQQLGLFEKAVRNVYDNVKNPGLDLISMLMEKIENEKSIIKTDTFFTNSSDTTFIHFQNHIYIFTDGYLEYANQNKNRQFYFSTTQIDKVRQYCIQNRVDIKTALNKQESLGLPKFFRDVNKNLYLHILETHERDKDLKYLAYNHVEGQRDNEILEAVWKKWAVESGFKNLEWKKY